MQMLLVKTDFDLTVRFMPSHSPRANRITDVRSGELQLAI